MNHFSSSTTHSPIHRQLTRGLASCQNHRATADAKPTISSGGSPFAAALLRAMHCVLFLARLCFVELFQRSNVARCHCLRLKGLRLITLRDSLFLQGFTSRPCTGFALNRQWPLKDYYYYSQGEDNISPLRHLPGNHRVWGRI